MPAFAGTTVAWQLIAGRAVGAKVMVGQRPRRVFDWAIEEIEAAHPHLYLEHFAAMAAAIMSRRSEPPCELEVECQGFTPAALGQESRFRVRVSSTAQTAARAGRILDTEQRKPVVERAAVAVAALLIGKLIPGGEMRVTRAGERADYWLPRLEAALEVSGTEQPRELERRHREKIAQVRGNPLAWPGYAVVCSFGGSQPLVRWSYHEVEARIHGTS